MSAAASARDRGVEVLLVGSVWEAEVLVSLLWEASFIRGVTRELAQEPKVQTAFGRPLIHMETRHLHQQPLLVLCKLENVLAVLEGRLGPLLPAVASLWKMRFPSSRASQLPRVPLSRRCSADSRPRCAYFYMIADVVIPFLQLILP